MRAARVAHKERELFCTVDRAVPDPLIANGLTPVVELEILDLSVDVLDGSTAKLDARLGRHGGADVPRHLVAVRRHQQRRSRRGRVADQLTCGSHT
jgi:hypothetical protein